MLCVAYLSTCINPRPVESVSSSPSPTGIAVFSSAFLTLYGLTGIPSACKKKQKDSIYSFAHANKITCQINLKTFIPLISKATPPQAEGDDMEVPFISMRRCRVQVGTGATAPPGALMQTPRSPSVVGPRLDLSTPQKKLSI